MATPRTPTKPAHRTPHPCHLAFLCLAALALALLPSPAPAQENPLGTVQTPTPAPPPKSPEDKKPILEGPGVAAHATARPASRIRVDVNLVQVPLTVTDPMNRLVTGLEKDNFQIFDNNSGQTIKYFSTEDAPLTIGVVFDLSGSMSSKFVRARKALTEFLRTSNPEDEFFVVGFNDRPAVIVDYTSDVDDVEARMVMLKPENRTALIDAVYLGVDHLRKARYDRKAILIISDGGDNRSRYTENELRRVVREADVQIYSIGIFDAYANTTEEQLGPQLLTDVCEMTGGRLFKVGDVGDLSDIASRISAELRNEYVIGYTPTEAKHDGQWRKLKVRLIPHPVFPNSPYTFARDTMRRRSKEHSLRKTSRLCLWEGARRFSPANKPDDRGRALAPAGTTRANIVLLLLAATFAIVPQHSFSQAAPTQPSLEVDRDPAPSPDPDPPPTASSGTQGTPLATINRGAGGKYTLHEDAYEVRLNASVFDQAGHSIQTLAKDDFHVYEDGVPQAIAGFRHEDLPVSLGILIDSSGSMYDKRVAVNQASLDLVKLSNPEDEAFLVDFSWEAFIDQDFTSDISKLEQGLSYVKPSGGTAIYDALVASADYLSKNARHPKQVLLVITDGEDNASSATLEQAIRRIQDFDGPVIYCVGLLFGDDTNKSESRHARRVLETLAEQTGGAAYFPKSIKEVDAIAREVAEDIRTQYSIAYHSTKSPTLGGYRQVHVDAKAKGFTKLSVRTRTGYYPRVNNGSTPDAAP